jgi:hypothetical protein
MYRTSQAWPIFAVDNLFQGIDNPPKAVAVADATWI